MRATARSYGYFPHDEDIGIIGRGGSVEEAFIAAAEAMLALAVDIAQVHAEREVAFEFEEADVELALVTWLNRLLAEMRGEGLVPARFGLHRDGARWHGRFSGEPWHEGLDRGTEVKRATLTLLMVAATDDGYEARCVVDV